MVGFSIIELMVVVAIMCVLIGLGVATLSSPKGAGEITQAGSMVSDLARLAREHALSKNTRTVLVIAPIKEGGEDRLGVSIWDGANTNQLERWNLLPTSVAANKTSSPSDPLKVKFRNSEINATNTFWFYPDGRMGDGLTTAPKLRIQSNRGSNVVNFYELVFNPVTGTAKVNRP